MKNMPIIAIFLFFICTGFSIDGRVIKIINGKTVHVLTKNKGKTLIVNLRNIDAPGIRQPLGKEAKKKLSDLAYGQHVTVYIESRISRNLHVLGTLWLKNNKSLNINMELISLGYAWVDPKFSNDNNLIAFSNKTSASLKHTINKTKIFNFMNII